VRVAGFRWGQSNMQPSEIMSSPVTIYAANYKRCANMNHHSFARAFCQWRLQWVSSAHWLLLEPEKKTKHGRIMGDRRDRVGVLFLGGVNGKLFRAAWWRLRSATFSLLGGHRHGVASAFFAYLDPWDDRSRKARLIN